MTGVALVLALVAWMAAQQPPPAPLPHVLSERTIASFLQPSDIRWFNDGDVIIADVMQGLARISVGDAGAPVTWLEQWQRPKTPDQLYAHVAVSDAAVLSASYVFAMRWHARSGDERLQTIVLAAIHDVDLDGDRVLIVGWQRDQSGMPAEGAIAWIGSLSGGAETLRPILPFRSLTAISGCGMCGLGVARFLGDGSFIVIPGAESGVYHFAKDGKLHRVWQSPDLGLDINCEFTEAQKTIINTQPLARQQWVNRRAMVDEIIDTPAGPALIVRKVSDGLTQWDMLLLNGPSPKVQKLPFTSPSPWAHISAAWRGDRIAFLIGDRLENQKDGAPARLILADWKSQ